METATASTAVKRDQQLAEALIPFRLDPLGFVLAFYPWGEKGPLERFQGPDTWQSDFLQELGEIVREREFDGHNAVAPIRMTRSSGHGIGKSTLAAWVVNWIMSTRPHSQGTVTANTFPQLQLKTWAAIQKWTKLLPHSNWFNITGERIYHVQWPESWFCSALTCREEKSEAFAGQHAAESTSFYLFDEASAVPDKIFEVAEGGLTDGEPMMFVFGNPTRNNGKFHRINFGSERSLWNQACVDSRSCSFPNKQLIEEWIKTYGEDSDFVRVRVKGIAPRAGDLQFIDSERVWMAQKRLPLCLPDDPLVCGVDVARGGDDANVIRFRRGLDARSVPCQRIPGEQTRDSMFLVSKLSMILAEKAPDRKVSFMFVDSAFGGPVVNRLHQLGFKNVMEVNFGSKAPDMHCANMRAYMWSQLRDWLLTGAIDDVNRLEVDLTSPGYHHNNQQKLVIESKEDMAKRGLSSPDDGDALALTFAQPVAPTTPKKFKPFAPVSVWS